MDIQFNTDSSIMGTENVAERVEAHLRDRLSRFAERLTRLEVHLTDTNKAKGGADDVRCMIEARPRGGDPLSVTANSATVDAAARDAANKLVTVLDRQFGKAGRQQASQAMGLD